MNFIDFSSKEKKEIYSILNSRDEGLITEEVKELRNKFGFNEIKTKSITFLTILFRQFKSVFFYLLIIASILSFLLGETISSLLILIFVSINVILGFTQEYKAQKAQDILKTYMALTSKVIRSDKEEIIESRLLLPGDIVVLEPGDIVPGDIRILESCNLLIDESILTGESEPAMKSSSVLSDVKEYNQAHNIAFSSTLVVSGSGKGIVISIGQNTEIGHVSKLTSLTQRPSIYEKELSDFSKIIFKTVGITFLLIFVLNLVLRRQPNIVDFTIFCIALIVGIIPEALPVIVTSSLSRGALKLSKQDVIVKRLSSIGDLGNMEMLCTDKTGTLTENKLALQNVNSIDKEKCFLYAFLASNPENISKQNFSNPFDKGIFNEIQNKEAINDYLILSKVPFDFTRIGSSVLVKNKEEKNILIFRGTAETTLRLIAPSEKDLVSSILKEIKDRERNGERILVVAYKDFDKENHNVIDEKDLHFLGYISFVDPIKSTTKETVQLAKKLKIKIKIISGDSKEVCGKVAFDIGLINDVSDVVSGNELIDLSPQDFYDKCINHSVFARISPELKLKIIQSLQATAEVGFMGDGINDAPALKAANVGIAVMEATNVSKEVADILLLKRDLKIVIEGVKEGRIIFSNINKYIKCALSSNFGNFYSIAFMSFILPFLPMLPSQILLENIMSDTPLISISSDSVDVEELRRPKQYALSHMFPYILILALISCCFDFIFLWIFHKQLPAVLRTSWFLMSILTEIALIYSVRSRRSFLKAPKPSKILVYASSSVVLVSFILVYTKFGQRIFEFTVLSPALILIILSLVTAYLFTNEFIKKIYFKRHQLSN